VIDLKNILIRCDSSLSIGLGHVKRCLLLAQRLKQQDEYLNISFATQELTGNINLEILKAGFNIYTLKTNAVEELSSLVLVLELKLLIIDSYGVDAVFESTLKQSVQGLKILSFDDTLQAHHCDMVLNHGIQAKKKMYATLVLPTTKVFCGSAYTLLRDEFFQTYQTKIQKNSVAIILGGNDVLNLSLKAAKLLLKINSNYKISVITSRVNGHIDTLKNEHNIEVLVDIDNIAEVLSSKQFVVCASGGTLFEVMALKKKFVNIQVASNQNSITQFLENRKIDTTVCPKDLTLEVLKEKLKYIQQHDVYEKLDLKFSKKKLAKKIVKELT
jgi:UDP-2,4-diacetamido-2,4,6-trideoxy-beta-L-altropyranose hydrolase